MDIKILIKNLTWFNLVEKLKVILNKLVASAFIDAPIDGNQYVRQDGEWEQVVIPSAGVESVSGDYVDNTDPLNPILGDPRPYKVLSGLLTQVGTGDPDLTILDNTTGKLFSAIYTSVGQYDILVTPSSPTPVFPPNKTVVLTSSVNPNHVMAIFVAGANSIRVNVKDLSGTLINGALYNTPFDVKIYD